MDKILSVSIAAYNVEDYLTQALDSLCVESVIEDLEILVISDGSTDNTVNIARSYEKKYPNSFRVIEKENGGWGSTVNKGMELATGKYFKLLDGDDWFYSENLKNFVKYLKNTQADIVFSAFGMYDDVSEKILAIKNMPFQPNYLYNFENIALTCPIHMHELAVKTDLLKNANIHILEHCFYTDIQFVAELFAKAKTMVYYKKPVYCYRVGREDQSVSLSGLLKHMGDNMKVVTELLRYKEGRKLAPNVEKAYNIKINYAISLELYSYCTLNLLERRKKVRQTLSFIRENSIEFKSVSAEVNFNLKTRFIFSKPIHFAMEIVRKIAKALNIDLIYSTLDRRFI